MQGAQGQGERCASARTKMRLEDGAAWLTCGNVINRHSQISSNAASFGLVTRRAGPGGHG
jgi:hypothetical protein